MDDTRAGDRNRLLVHPASARVVLDVLRGPTDGGRDITRTVMSDPALAASVLRAANSAHLEYSRRIGSIRQAAVMLGSSLVGSLADSSTSTSTLSCRARSMSTRCRRRCTRPGSSTWPPIRQPAV